MDLRRSRRLRYRNGGRVTEAQGGYSSCTRAYRPVRSANVTSVTISEARANLPALLTRVTEGEEVTITRHGRPVAVVVRPDVLRSRRAEGALQQAGEVHELLAAARGRPLSRSSGLSLQYAEELIGDIRAGRDQR